MKARVSLPEFNEILYDGLMRDMPEYVPYKLYSSKPATSDLFRIPYLDTSVKREYMGRNLADFKWWIENRKFKSALQQKLLLIHILCIYEKRRKQNERHSN